MKTMKQWNFAIAFIAAILGIVMVTISKEFPIVIGMGDPGSGFWPTVLGYLLILLAVLLILVNIVGKNKNKEKKVILSTPANIQVYIFMSIIVVYCVLLYFLGFFIASFMFIPCSMYILGVRNKKMMLISCMLILVAIYIIFQIILRITLPLPIFLR